MCLILPFSKFNPILHGKNVKEIRKIEENVKHKKQDKENYIPPEPFKMREFKNVPSKIDNVNKTPLHPRNENNMNRNKSTTLLKPKTTENANVKGVKVINKLSDAPQYKSNNEENIYNIGNSNQVNNGEYQIFSHKDYVISTVNYETSGNQGNHYSRIADDRSSNQKNQSKSQTKLPIIKNNKTRQDEVPKAKSKTKIKGLTPKADDTNSLLPKKVVNHIQENRSLNSVPNRAKVSESKEDEQFEHKNYGKVPD